MAPGLRPGFAALAPLRRDCAFGAPQLPGSAHLVPCWAAQSCVEIDEQATGQLTSGHNMLCLSGDA